MGACGNSGLEGGSFRSRNFLFRFGNNRGNRNFDGTRAGAGDRARGSPRSTAAIVARCQRSLARPDSRLPRLLPGLPRLRPHCCFRPSAEELRTRVLELVSRDGMLRAGVGLLAGLLVSLALTRVLTSQLFAVSALDPLTFGGVLLLLAGVAVGACYIP